MKARLIKLHLPADLAAHVENVDGRKVAAMIFSALRAQWGPKVTKIHLGSYVAIQEQIQKEPTYPIYGSIPADRKP